jgi:hypothetical protein
MDQLAARRGIVGARAWYKSHLGYALNNPHEYAVYPGWHGERIWTAAWGMLLNAAVPSRLR